MGNFHQTCQHQMMDSGYQDFKLSSTLNSCITFVINAIALIRCIWPMQRSIIDRCSLINQIHLQLFDVHGDSLMLKCNCALF